MSEDRTFSVIDDECVACNLCVNVCPVEDCISMEELAAGTTDLRTLRNQIEALSVQLQRYRPSIGAGLAKLADTSAQ